MLKKDKKLHYRLTKKYFKKNAILKKGFYTSKCTEELKQQIRKRDMWGIYYSSLEEILKNNSDITSVIDVGCGMGNFTLELVNREQFKKIVGIDFLKETLRLACENEKLLERVSFIEGNLLNIPFNDRSFDITICLNVLHHIHVKDLSNALQELARITNKYLILEIRNERNIFNFWHNHLILPIFYKDLPIYTTSISDVNDLMINHNFQLQTIRRKPLLSQICRRFVVTYKREDLGGYLLKGNKNTRFSIIFTNSRRIISCYKFNFLELLAIKMDLFYNLLMKWRKPVFLKEIKMAKITSQDKVLLIGCGILPSETVLIAQQTKARIIGIDNSIKACNIAQSYVQKKGLSDLIKIEYGDGANYPLIEFDVIFIAINVWPIDLVLKNLLYNAKPNTRIMCKSIKNDILKSIEKREFHNSFSIESQLENPKTQSFLLIKK